MDFDNCFSVGGAAWADALLLKVQMMINDPIVMRNTYSIILVKVLPSIIELTVKIKININTKE